jgi:predicted O-methyltransferase YrrM
MRRYHDEMKNLLAEYASTTKPDSYLEVGTQEGNSIRAVLGAHRIRRLVICDDWGNAAGGTGRGNHNHILPIVEGVESVTFFDGNSHETLKRIREQFDLITVDGDHSESGAEEDLKDCWRLLKRGGVLMMDDLFHPQHLYIHGIILRFVESHPDAELVRIERYNNGAPGCAVIRKR